MKANDKMSGDDSSDEEGSWGEHERPRQMSPQSIQACWDNKLNVHLAVQPDKLSWEQGCIVSAEGLHFRMLQRLPQRPFRVYHWVITRLTLPSVTSLQPLLAKINTMLTTLRNRLCKIFSHSCVTGECLRVIASLRNTFLTAVAINSTIQSLAVQSGATRERYRHSLKCCLCIT